MKIYVVDAGWQGAVAIVADNREEAFEIAQTNGVYYLPDDADEFEEHEFVKGVIVDCAGDQ